MRHAHRTRAAVEYRYASHAPAIQISTIREVDRARGVCPFVGHLVSWQFVDGESVLVETPRGFEYR